MDQFEPLRQSLPFQTYLATPKVTRFYITACGLTTLLVHLDEVSPLQLCFDSNLILRNLQLWRLATTFLFFGRVGFRFFFNMGFTYRYGRMLEESFTGRSSDFFMMFVFGGVLMILLAFFVNSPFLGQAFTIMIVCVWSRRYRFCRMNFYGLNFQAPYLPWVVLCCSMILGNTIWIDLMGMAVGHIYYFLEDVFPRRRNGFKLLKGPVFLKVLFNEHKHRIKPSFQFLPEPDEPNWCEEFALDGDDRNQRPPQEEPQPDQRADNVEPEEHPAQ